MSSQTPSTDRASRRPLAPGGTGGSRLRPPLNKQNRVISETSSPGGSQLRTIARPGWSRSARFVRSGRRPNSAQRGDRRKKARPERRSGSGFWTLVKCRLVRPLLANSGSRELESLEPFDRAEIDSVRQVAVVDARHQRPANRPIKFTLPFSSSISTSNTPPTAASETCH
jgi:hypothetical protein